MNFVLTLNIVVGFFAVTVLGQDFGIDVSTLTTSSSASCFVSSGKSFIIPRGYRSSGSVDPNVCATLINAEASGIKTRDVYMWVEFLNWNLI